MPVSMYEAGMGMPCGLVRVYSSLAVARIMLFTQKVHYSSLLNRVRVVWQQGPLLSSECTLVQKFSYV
jgi:hypothetical protein